MMHTKSSRAFTLAAALLICSGARAQVQLTVSDDFTQAKAQNDWATFDGACLTAGDGSGTIPACVGLPYYQGQALVGGTSGALPDEPGAGALRLTNGYTAGKPQEFKYGFNQAGGIIS